MQQSHFSIVIAKRVQQQRRRHYQLTSTYLRFCLVLRLFEIPSLRPFTVPPNWSPFLRTQNRNIFNTLFRHKCRNKFSPLMKSISSSQNQSLVESLSTNGIPTTWDDVINSSTKNSLLTQTDIIMRTVPKLTSSSHKGSSGRVGILGGSERYTGAPYYAAMAALQTGVDLVYIFCAQEATIPIKSYSPELMVQSVYSAQVFNDWIKESSFNNDNTILSSPNAIMTSNTETTLVHEMAQQVIDMLDRLHCLIIGPGLGRCPLVFKATSRIIQQAIHRDISLVLDADALYMLTMDEFQYLIPALTQRPMSNTILTPNVVEYNNFVGKIGNGSEQTLKLKMNNIILIRKGSQDVIQCFRSISSLSQDTSTRWRNDEIDYMICDEKGGLKRCGGLGDILSGCVGAFTAWFTILNKSQTGDYNSASLAMCNLVLSCWLACCLTKRATYKAFVMKKRSMASPDVLQNIGEVMNDIASSSIQTS